MASSRVSTWLFRDFFGGKSISRQKFHTCGCGAILKTEMLHYEPPKMGISQLRDQFSEMQSCYHDFQPDCSNYKCTQGLLLNNEDS